MTIVLIHFFLKHPQCGEEESKGLTTLTRDWEMDLGMLCLMSHRFFLIYSQSHLQMHKFSVL